MNTVNDEPKDQTATKDKRMVWPQSDRMLDLTLALFGVAALSALAGLPSALLHIDLLIKLTDLGWKIGFGGFLLLFGIGLVVGARADR